MTATCVEFVRTGGIWSASMRACGKTAKVERDGKAYCGIHDPERVKAKRAERDAAYDRREARGLAQNNLDIAEQVGGRLLADHIGELPSQLDDHRTFIRQRRAELAALDTEKA